jgi:hypothetical protein
MDQQPHGNFIAFINRSKQPGDNLPTFDGRIAIPGSEEERRFVLWAHEYKNPKTGEMLIMFNGQTDAVLPGAAPMDQVAALIKQAPTASREANFGNLKLAPRQIVLFPNGFKAEAPEKNRPDYWGAFNPGNGDPTVRISVWAKKDRNQHAMLGGATSYPIPGKSEVQQQDASPDLKDLVDQGVVSKGMPAKTKGRGRGEARA